jgi:outer membrane biosynthesis protein TonB
MAAGAVPSVNLGALAAFLLTGQPQPAVTPSPLEPPPPAPPAPPQRTPAAPAPPEPQARPAAPPPPAEVAAPPPTGAPGRKPWMRPAAYATGALAILSAGIATWQGLSAASAYRNADGMLRADGALRPGVDPAAYQAARQRGDAAAGRAWVGVGVAALAAAASGVLWVLSREPQLPGALSLRF